MSQKTKKYRETLQNALYKLLSKYQKRVAKPGGHLSAIDCVAKDS